MLIVPRRRVAASGWTPAQISTALWLDAADSATVTTVSGAVSQWNDKSGNARHATQSTAGNRPAYTSSGLNGYNVVTFNGSSTFLNCPQLVMSGYNWTAITVLTMLSNAQPYARYLSTAASGTADYQDSGGWSLFYRNSNTSAISTAFSNSVASLFTINLGQPYLCSVTRTQTSITSFLNGTAGSGSTGTFVSLNGTGGARIGRSLNPSYESNENWSGISAEIIIIQNLTTTDRQLLEGYLAWKWGLVASLPAGHPYKTAAP